MKSKFNGLLFMIAMLAVVAALFLPVSVADTSRQLLERLKPLVSVSVLAWLLASVAFWAFKARFWTADVRERERLNNTVLLIVLQAVLLRTVFELAAVYRPMFQPWLQQEAWVWMPWFLIPGLTGILLGGRFGVLMCLTGAFMLYLFAHPGPWPVTGCMTAALAGILLLRRSPTRGRVLRAGAGAGGVLGMVAAAHGATQGAALDGISAAVLVPVSVGVISAFLVLALLPLLEWLLGELSDVTLVEYGSDHQLLDQLRNQAPGTWHHSLNVADMAERAAAEVGANALFCKTAALYHDIGKLKEPAFFAENNEGASPHDGLEPHVSAQKIIGHVAFGLELARKHRLPGTFRDIIAEHHGSSLVRFFYAKACQPLPNGSQPVVERSRFCYNGRSPSSRESGIIALADTVEAASRSFFSRSQTELQAFVRRLFADRISEGELAACPLTLSDLAKVETVFVGWLKGRNHQRPAYPEQTGEPVVQQAAVH